jgi:hypothetical protein
MRRQVPPAAIRATDKLGGMVIEYSLSTVPTIPCRNGELNAESDKCLIAVRATMSEAPLLPDTKPQHQGNVRDEEGEQADANGSANPTIVLGVTVNVTTPCCAT